MKKIPPTLTRALLMAASGFLLIFAGQNLPACAPGRTEPDRITEDFSHIGEAGEKEESTGEYLRSRIESIGRAAGQAVRGLSRKRPGSVEPSVLEYNLMELYPEEATFLGHKLPPNLDLSRLERFLACLGADLSSSFEGVCSYGQQMYEQLNEKDAQWAAEIYQWIQSTPEQAMKRIGLANSYVLGRFNPANPNHDPENPETWVIPSWKNVSFCFTDGDGSPVSLHSNAVEILSMASVYTYYEGWTDVELFREYIDRLWNASHQFRVEVGKVYYCGGCTQLLEEETVPGKEKKAEKAASPSELSADSLLPDPREEGAHQNPSQQDVSRQEMAKKDSAGPNTSSQADSREKGAGDLEKALATALAASPETGAVRLNEEGKFCPGHVDLTITGRINGLSERSGLFSLDQIGSQTTERWRGWSVYSRAYVEKLESRDWTGRYGLAPQELVLGMPLNQEEREEYLALLPGDTSKERREIIACALDSVGKIPYYYGGRAKQPGLVGNQFGTVTAPDRKGRILSGLDCSGWVNWVYWTALGKSLGQQGTSGLIHMGRGISQNDLKPGDLLIRTGSDSHVVMYLGQAPDGSILGIHESGSANNVTVGKISSGWPYYRAILD